MLGGSTATASHANMEGNPDIFLSNAILYGSYLRIKYWPYIKIGLRPPSKVTNVLLRMLSDPSINYMNVQESCTNKRFTAWQCQYSGRHLQHKSSHHAFS